MPEAADAEIEASEDQRRNEACSASFAMPCIDDVITIVVVVVGDPGFITVIWAVPTLSSEGLTY